MEKCWWHNSVVYQIYPRSFCDLNNDGIGDLQGVISKLDYLKNLGINVIWLSPVYQSPMDDNGYDISDYQAIAAEFGTMDDIRELFAQAKKHDIKIIMDLVLNHTSDEHAWFIEAKKSQDNPYRDYYIWRDAKPDGSEPTDMGSVFGGSGWEWDESTQQYYLHIFTKKQPDLNWENPKIQTEIHKMMNWWIEQGIGGFRLDVIDLIGKEIDKGITGNGPRLHPLIQQMNKDTFGGKDLLTVGETWDADPEIAKLYSSSARNEFSMIFQFEHVTLTWKDGDKWQPVDLDLRQFKQVLTKWQVELADDGWNSLFWNNHDLPRVVSKYGNDKELRVESAKMLATTMHLLKGTPYIYQGEEIGMTNVHFDSLDQYRDVETLNFYKERTESGVSHDDMLKGIHANSRDNARTPMQWDSTKNAGFSKGEPWIGVNPNYSEINVKSALADPNSIFYHYKKLIEIRKDESIIVYGEFIPLFEDLEKVFAYVRQQGKEKILVINNFSEDHLEINTPEPFAGMQGKTLISNYNMRSMLQTTLYLQPYESFAIKYIE